MDAGTEQRILVDGDEGGRVVAEIDHDDLDGSYEEDDGDYDEDSGGKSKDTVDAQIRDPVTGETEEEYGSYVRDDFDRDIMYGGPDDVDMSVHDEANTSDSDSAGSTDSGEAGGNEEEEDVSDGVVTSDSDDVDTDADMESDDEDSGDASNDTLMKDAIFEHYITRRQSSDPMHQIQTLTGGADPEINRYIKSLKTKHAFLKDYQYLIYQYFLSEYFTDKMLLILWMTVGSGKTLLSISCGIAGLRTKMFDKVVILSPKSIQDEFRKNLLLYCTLSNPKGTASDIIAKQYDEYMSHFHLIAYNSGIASKTFHGIRQLEKSLFIIDEAHLFTKAIMKVNLMSTDLKKSNMMNRGNAKRIYDSIKKLKHKKVLALTGTPSSKMPFEMVPLFNLAYSKDMFTTNMDDFNDYYINREDAVVEHKEELIDKLNGLIAYVPRPITSTSVRATPLITVDVEMGYEQYKQYLVDYKKELDELGPSPFMNMYGYKFGKVSSYHTKTFEDCIYWNKYLTNKDQEDRYVGGPHTVNMRHCPKLIKMFSDTLDINGTCVFYFRFTGIYGVESMGRLLDLNGYRATDPREKVYQLGPAKRYAIFSGDVSSGCRNKWKDWFNDARNVKGEYIKYLILSPSGSVGITLKNVRYLGIANVDFAYATIRQILGRCNRLGSHDDLPKSERTLVNKIYIMTKNMKYYNENKAAVQELCSREAPDVDEIAPTIERIVLADAIHDDRINEDFKNNVLIPASITEKVYKDFGKGE